VKSRFYTTTVTGSEGEGKQSVSFKGLGRLHLRDLNKNNTTVNIYDILLNYEFIW
jgi:hypothetical protein